jgi:anaerobic magnesium-protoporphyrin IX monomethyl ester cyclase
MKVFLHVPRCLNPKRTYREYPLGVGMIATALRRHGCDVLLYDQNAEGPDDDRLFDHLREFQPDLVGFSVITPSYPVAKSQIERLRRDRFDAFVVAGGVHAGLFPEDLLADGADAVVIGDGCAAMSALVERITCGAGVSPAVGEQARRLHHKLWHGLPGVAYREDDGRIVRPTRAATRFERDGVPDVDRDVFNLPLYTHHSMLASLGCPHRCTFCCNYAGTAIQDGVTIRSHDAICREMHYLAERYQATQVFFVDDVFLLSRGNVLGFCRRLERENLAMQWIAQMRVDAIDADVAAAMRNANCQRVYFGVESGSDAILQRIRKGIDRATIRHGIRSARDAGLRVKSGWVFGLPGTLEEQYEAVAFMRELRPHEISIHQFIPFPGTPYYQDAAGHGIRIRDPKDFAGFCYGGLGDNIAFDYLSRTELDELLLYTIAVLESEGYVSSDRATPDDEYVYSTPLNESSMNVFHSRA